MMKLVECVPNFSNGRDQAVIDQITHEIKEVAGAVLLDVDPGADTNRTVVTMIGSPEAMKEAAFRVIKKASELIDMRKQTGAHARQGATDVCPFVPVSGVTMEKCVKIAKEVGERVGRELQIPIYLYENAASKPEWRNLAEIRKGEYEALEEKLAKPEWKPDFGPAKFNASAGATAIGAREFLIAYNVNLNTRNPKLAKKIAFNIREQGKAKRDANGKIVRDKNGEIIYVPGTFKALKGMGWYIEEYGQAQVTMNLINYKISPPHLVYEEIKKEAEALGLSVTGSELVGLIPRDAILEAGRYYLRRQNQSLGVPEKELIHITVKSMGLEDISEFNPKKKIIEYAYKEDEGKLASMSLREFTDELSSDSPAPGGGSVAAQAGAQAAGLVAMVANLTFGKKDYKEVWDKMSALAEKGQKLKDDFLAAIDDDTDAFNDLMTCFRMPKKSDEEKAARDEAIQEATKHATMVPFRVLKNTIPVLELAETVAKEGNQNSLSDAGVAVSMSRSAAEGACMNVLINLKDITDVSFVKKTKTEAMQILDSARATSDRLLKDVFAKLN